MRSPTDKNTDNNMYGLDYNSVKKKEPGRRSKWTFSAIGMGKWDNSAAVFTTT